MVKMSGCTVAEYAAKCREIDDSHFSVSAKHMENIQLDEFDNVHEAFWTKLHECKENDRVLSIVNIRRMSLKSRGKANQLLHSKLSGKRDGSFIMQYTDDARQVMSIDKIFGVRNDSGEVNWMAFYGPVWEIESSEDLFEVFEFNARRHYKGERWWGIEEVSLPCWVRHIHRFEHFGHWGCIESEFKQISRG